MIKFCRKIAYYLWSVIELLFSVKNWGTLFSIFLGKPFSGLKWLKFHRQGLTMAVTSRMEAWSVKESMIDRFYLRYSDPIQPDWTIVDIGASIGEFTVEASLQVPEGKVIVFEPNPGSLNILRQNVRVNNLKNVETHNVGIWKEDGEITLEIIGNDPIHARSFDVDTLSDEAHKRTSIPVISLETMLETVVKGSVDLMKVDTEGTEFDILLSQPAETFSQIKRIILEVHENFPEQTAERLILHLGAMGYQTRQYANKVHENLSYLYAWRL